jgi:hypothetical protein
VIAKKTRTKSAKALKKGLKRLKRQSRPQHTMQTVLLSSVAVVAFAVMVVAGSAYQSASNGTAPETPASSSRVTPSPTRPSTRPVTAEPRPASSSAAATAPAAFSTHVGCLRAEDDGRKFVLTDVEGEGAPQKRNWKTLFVTKKKSSKLVVEAAGAVRFEPHVGRTVQLTGIRNDDVFEARSLRVVRPGCG